MLKKIDIKQLRVGMYCRSWVNIGTVVRQAFFISNQIELDQIINSGIKEAFIDTDKGLDVLSNSAPIAKKAIRAMASKKPIAQAAPVTMNEELNRASKIVDRSKEAITSMFHEARMGGAFNIEHAVSLVEEITASVMRNPDALIGLARLKTKDDYTYMHSVAVCALMVSLARQLGLSDEQTRESGLAGLLHDIGKMAIPLEILNNPGKLTDAEFNVVKDHPMAGHQMLLEGGAVGETTLDVCLHHHEKMDGTGYPKQLSGDAISVFARMGAVCDVYDAITSNRPYKQGWCPSESLRKMAEWEGHFDKVIFQAFVKCIGIYPVGTLVRLKSGRLGVVVEQQIGKSLLSPKVRVFFSNNSNSYIMPELLDLADPITGDKIVAREDAEKWQLKNIDQYWLGDKAVLSQNFSD
jgi:putative nucleotidyltransferase with HDIG domain